MKIICSIVVLTTEGPDPLTVLVRKNRPARLSGTLNPPGGKVDPGETPEEAAVREVREETGIVLGTPPDPVCVLVSVDEDTGAMYNIHAFSARIPREDALGARTLTDEEVLAVPVRDALADGTLHRPWLLQMAISGARVRNGRVYEL